MTKTLSLWKPWTIGSPEAIIDHALALGCNELCLKAVDGAVQYGVNNWVRARWGGLTQHDLAREIRAAGLGLSIWVVPYFWDWAREVDAILQAVQFYDPSAVFLDIEVFRRKGWFRGTDIDGQGHIRNVSSFLRRLGRLEMRVYFQGPRRLDLHPEVQAQIFFSARDENGRHLIDGVGAQLYPIGVDDPVYFLADFERSIAAQEQALEKAGRVGLPYFPTLPAFEQGGWSPPPAGLMQAAAWLHEALDERLLGFNFWALDYLIEMPELYAVVETLEDPAPEAGPPPAESRRFMELCEAERWALVQQGFQRLGLLDEEGRAISGEFVIR